MVDNTPQNGTNTVATDDIGGVHYQRNKVVFGVDGVATDVSAANPLPVTQPGLTFTVPNNDAVGSVSGPLFVSYNMLWDGANWVRARGTTTGTNVVVASALPAGTNLIGITGDQTDVGRVIRHFIMDNYVAAPATEALMSVTQFYNNATVAGTTTPAVIPAGKKLRLTGARLSTKSLAAAGSVVLRTRFNTAGVAAVTSPIVHTLEVGSVAAVAGLLSETIMSFPEGIDLPAAGGVGFTLAGYNATGVLTLQGVTRFEVWGYEYTA